MGKNKVVPISAGAKTPKQRHLKISVSKGAGIQIKAEMVEEDTASVEVDGAQKKYSIGTDDTVRVLPANAPEPADEGLSFGSLEQVEQETQNWPMRRLVSVWNQLPGHRPVRRFENRSIALARLWRAIEKLEPAPVPQEATPSSEEEPKLPSKTQRVIDLLRAAEGVTLTALMEATGWQAHSVRGFLSGKLSKQMGLPVASFRRDGARVYMLKDAAGEEK